MRRLVLVMAAVLVVPLVRANTISTYAGGTDVTLGSYAYGQAVTTPSDGPWDHVVFAFLGSVYTPDGLPWVGPVPVVPPYGTLFLFSQEYLGAPMDLGGGPGLIAASSNRTADGWVFDEALILLPSTVYYFYGNELLGGAGGLGDGPGVGFSDPPGGYISGCNEFYPEPRECPFGGPGGSINYRLSGTAIPEPSALWLLASGIGLLAIRRRCS